MSKKATLVFGVGGTTAHIVFVNGKESDIFESKQEVLHALPGLIKSSKITDKEALEITKAALYAKGFPTEAPQNGEPQDFFDLLMGDGMFGVGFGPFGNMLGLAGFGMMASGGNIREKIMSLKIFPNLTPDTVIEKPIFKMCPCGGLHGMILFNTDKKGALISSILLSKKQARGHVEKYKEEYTLPEDQEKELLESIEASPLPEMMKMKKEEDATVEHN